MLKGDLSSTTIAEVLRQLADGDATGCLHVTDPAGEVAKTYLRGGRVYAVLAPGRRPQLGSRLVSSGALAPEALAEAYEAQRTELQGWRLGELLVHLGYVDQPVVQAFVEEQVRESLSDVLPWRSGTWKFRVNERTREDVAPPTAVDVLLEEITSRRSHWAAMEQTLHGPDSVPVLSTAGSSSDEMEIDPDAWSLLCKVDGARSITELARECGFTLYEAGQVVFTLVGAGLLEVEDGPVEPEVDLDDADLDEAEVEPLAPADVASRLVSALLAAPNVPSQSWAPDQEQLTERRRVSTRTDDASVNSSISRVSEALAGLLGPATADDDVFSGPTHRAAPAPVPELMPVVEDPKKAERARRAAARREADAEELATAQAELEAARAAEQERRDDLLPDGHVADVVDLHEVREAARLEEQSRAEQQRAEDEATAERLAAEQAEAERLAEAQRLAEEVEAAAASQAEADRIEQERLAAEQAEAERIAAEQEEAARLTAEQHRLADERAEAERLAAEHAEAERAAAEAAEIARAAAEQAERERVAAEQAEADRLATEAAEATRLENERLAAEQAGAERAAAEQAERERVAAERAEAERAEQERVAAEAARLEQERLLAEAEAERLATAAQARLDEELALAARAEFAEAARLEQESAAAAKTRAEQAAAADFASYAAEFDEADLPSYSADHAEAQAAAFAELSASASMDVADTRPAAKTAVADAPDPEPASSKWDDEPVPFFSPGDTDTASLLRELSSLGLDDDPPASGPTRPARPPSVRPVAEAPKKRKGLFGRG